MQRIPSKAISIRKGLVWEKYYIRGYKAEEMSVKQRGFAIRINEFVSGAFYAAVFPRSTFYNTHSSELSVAINMHFVNLSVGVVTF